MTSTEHIPLYRDGPHYDAMVGPLALPDVPFYVDEAKRARDPVLELACGTGRLTIPIAQNKLEIVGLDQSASMLAHARTKAAQAGVEIEWIEADCRTFSLKRKFALIFMAFNSMQHLHDQASLAALFANVRKHLAPGGRFVFDVFNPSLAILTRDPNVRHFDRQYEDPHGRGTIMLEMTAVYDDAAQVNRMKWYFSLPSQKDFQVEQLDVRCFFPQELDLLVRANGFQIEQKFGNFERRAFSSGDPKQIVVCS
ncbi:MAG TPA: class I SAM-dependent methyltransferase [Terriglobales bacterium]|nr:class I SAM-dependent methyltransferase [Terriglobales bacterium]